MLGELEAAKQIATEIAPTLSGAARGDTGRCFAVLGDIFAATGDEDEALAMYDAAINTFTGHRSPHLIRAYRQKAVLLERTGRASEALELLKQAIDLQDPSRAPLRQQ